MTYKQEVRERFAKFYEQERHKDEFRFSGLPEVLSPSLMEIFSRFLDSLIDEIEAKSLKERLDIAGKGYEKMAKAAEKNPLIWFDIGYRRALKEAEEAVEKLERVGEGPSDRVSRPEVVAILRSLQAHE